MSVDQKVSGTQKFIVGFLFYFKHVCKNRVHTTDIFGQHFFGRLCRRNLQAFGIVHTQKHLRGLTLIWSHTPAISALSTNTFFLTWCWPKSRLCKHSFVIEGVCEHSFVIEGVCEYSFVIEGVCEHSFVIEGVCEHSFVIEGVCEHSFVIEGVREHSFVIEGFV